MYIFMQYLRLARSLCLVLLMKLAVPTWQERVSPVFDVAANLLVIEFTDTEEISRQEIALASTDPARRAQQTAELGINVLICGAISWPLEMALHSAGIQVISQICGQVEDVVRSFRQGDLASDVFQMPGCCGRRRFRGGRGPGCRRGSEQAPPPEQRPGRMRRHRKRT